MTDSNDEPAFRLEASSADALRRQRREARAVLDHQIEALNDHDETALHTARIAVLILAVAVSVTRASNSTALMSVYFQAGSLGLVGTFALGVFTHGSASTDLGPRPSYIAEVRSGEYDERE